jgi:ketosteroid isomerase-like protein
MNRFLVKLLASAALIVALATGCLAQSSSPTSSPAPPINSPTPPTPIAAPPTSSPTPPVPIAAPPTSSPTPPANSPAQPTSSPAPQSFTGNWMGSFNIFAPDGSIHPDTALLVLKQEGSAITGTAGPNEGEQSPISVGTVTGQEIQFTIDTHGGRTMEFLLSLEDDHLKGYASGEAPDGKVTAAIDVTRVSDGKTTAPPAPSLFDEISKMDAIVFDAFNRRDLDKLKTLFTEDLEFYHDRGGLTNYQQNMDTFKKHFDDPTKVRRELVDGSLEVYPIEGYGAVEIGVHRFYSTDPGQKEKLTATAKFIHVWQKKNGEWKIARVISYDHR